MDCHPDISRHDSEAARFNDKILQELQKALSADPKADLLSVFPRKYSERLNGRKQEKGKNCWLTARLD